MRVHAFTQNIFPIKHDNYCNYNNSCVPILKLDKPDIFTPSFSGKVDVIKTASEFRSLAVKRKYPCLYCNRPLTYDEDMYKEWKRENRFSGPIIDFVKFFKKYTVSFHETESEIFSFIEFVAQRNPKAHLDTVIKLMSITANEELFKAQKPIFEAIKELAKKLPIENREKIDKLIDKSIKRILHIKHHEEYSGKEVRYRLEKLTKTLPDEKLTERVEKLTELLTIPKLINADESIDEKVITRVLRTIKPNIKKSKIKNLVHGFTREKLIEQILAAIKKEVQDLKRRDIYNICIEAEKSLHGEPIFRKFTNRAFRYDLKEALQGTDKDLRDRICILANNLPTSDNSLYAFVAKHDIDSSEKIAYDLFDPGKATVEHMKPKFLGGPKHIVSNFAAACKRCNNKRAIGNMGIFYKQFEPENAQNYWNKIIRDTNIGYFEIEDAEKMLEIFKNESSIKIDSSKLYNGKPKI